MPLFTADQPSSRRRIGTWAAVASAVLFMATIGMVKMASTMGAIGILGVRISGATLLFTLILLLFFKDDARSLVRRVRSSLPLIIGAATMIGTAFFLFAWAFLHGYGRSVAQAYLLIPFAILFGGRLFFAERLRRLQWLGVSFAGIGVGHELMLHGSLSWVTWVQTFTLTGYFLLHRLLHRQGCTAIQLLVAEFWLLFPIALASVAWEWGRVAPLLSSFGGVVVIVALWVVTTLAYLSYIVSNQYLSCAAFGMWGNLEPILILLASVLFFKETIPPRDLFTYVPMILGTILVVF